MEDEERRILALQLASKMVGSHGGFSRPGVAAVEYAKDFEKYLKEGK